jgi:hypothetical protein
VLTREATRAEWAQWQWTRRIARRRAAGVDRFWALERGNQPYSVTAQRHFPTGFLTMSKISVVVDSITDRLALIKTLRDLSGDSIDRISTNVKQGRPVAEYILFRNDHPEVAARLRQLIKAGPAVGATLRFFELPASANFAEPAERREISPETLNNILQASEREYERFLNEE